MVAGEEAKEQTSNTRGGGEDGETNRNMQCGKNALLLVMLDVNLAWARRRWKRSNVLFLEENTLH